MAVIFCIACPLKNLVALCCSYLTYAPADPTLARCIFRIGFVLLLRSLVTWPDFCLFSGVSLRSRIGFWPVMCLPSLIRWSAMSLWPLPHSAWLACLRLHNGDHFSLSCAGLDVSDQFRCLFFFFTMPFDQSAEICFFQFPFHSFSLEFSSYYQFLCLLVMCPRNFDCLFVFLIFLTCFCCFCETFFFKGLFVCFSIFAGCLLHLSPQLLSVAFIF